MRYRSALLVALALSGCSPDKASDVAGCLAEAERFYPSYLVRDPEAPASRYVIACMNFKGYNFTIEASACDSRFPLPTQATCYSSHGAVARIFDRLRGLNP